MKNFVYILPLFFLVSCTTGSTNNPEISSKQEVPKNVTVQDTIPSLDN